MNDKRRKPNNATCALCYENKELMVSHIIPKFVFNYIKKNSITGKFRDPTNFKMRYQDGPKDTLLCRDCEQLFADSEKYFAENIFTPFVDGKKINIKYDINLQYFVESVHWRFLLTQMNSYKGKELQILKDIEIGLRSRLRSIKLKENAMVLLNLEYPDYLNKSFHVLLGLEENVISMINSNFFDYKRMVTCDLFFYKNSVYIYSYLCGLIMGSVYKCRLIDCFNFRRYLLRTDGRFKLQTAKLNNTILQHILKNQYRTIVELIDNVPEHEQIKYKAKIEKCEKR